MQNWLQNKNQIDMTDLLVILGFPVSAMSPMSLTFCPPTCPLILLVQPCCFSSSRSAFFLSPKKQEYSLIRDQNSNKHIPDGYKKLFGAFKREAVQFLVAKNLAVSYLPLEAPPAVQTWTWTANATARPWSGDILWFAVCGFPWKPDARGLYWRNQAARERLEK